MGGVVCRRVKGGVSMHYIMKSRNETTNLFVVAFGL